MGGDAPLQHLVLQVHYINIDLLPIEGDKSGIDLLFTDQGMQALIGFTIKLIIFIKLKLLFQSDLYFTFQVIYVKKMAFSSILWTTFKRI